MRGQMVSSDGGFFRNGGARLSSVLLTLALLLVPYTASSMDYGKTGPYRVIRESFKNQISGGEVSVFIPDGAQMPVPVMFFSHGLGGTFYQGYKSILTHVASQGVAAVFSPYPTGLSWTEQYDILWSGFEKAADTYRYEFDLERVGFFGHSFGGGATPNMALRALERDWGNQGLLMFIMAPGPAKGITDNDLQSFTNANLITQVYENDTVAPHHIAEDIYKNSGMPSENKAYYLVHGGEHSEPSDRSVDDYDRLAIWTPLDALMDYTFNMDHPYEGKAFALDGEGDHYQTTILKDVNDGSSDQGNDWSGSGSDWSGSGSGSGWSGSGWSGADWSGSGWSGADWSGAQWSGSGWFDRFRSNR